MNTQADRETEKMTVLTTNMGTLFSFVHCIFKLTLLTCALVILSHVGNSNRSVSTVSFSSKFVSSPSPFSVLTLTLSDDTFLANLRGEKAVWIRNCLT